MRYVADDGKMFETVKECKEYEAELAEKQRKKEAELAERRRRYDELEEAYKNYLILHQKYEEDFGVIIKRESREKIKYPTILDFLLD